MTRTFAAIAAAATMSFGGIAAAQSMGEGYDMLTAALMSDFERLDIPTDTMDNLTIGQLAAIKNVLEDGDESNDKNQIEAIIANN